MRGCVCQEKKIYIINNNYSVIEILALVSKISLLTFSKFPHHLLSIFRDHSCFLDSPYQCFRSLLPTSSSNASNQHEHGPPNCSIRAVPSISAISRFPVAHHVRKVRSRFIETRSIDNLPIRQGSQVAPALLGNSRDLNDHTRRRSSVRRVFPGIFTRRLLGSRVPSRRATNVISVDKAAPPARAPL